MILFDCFSKTTEIIFTLTEEYRLSRVHASQRHDMKIGETRLVRIGDGQQVLQVPNLRVYLVSSSFRRSFGGPIHCGD